MYASISYFPLLQLRYDLVVASHTTYPSFTLLPNELILMIAKFLDVNDLNSLARTTPTMYQLLRYPLYRLAVTCKRRKTTSYFLDAVDTGVLSAVEFFIDAGVTVDEKDSLHWTALHRAAQIGNETIAQLLIDKGADVLASDICGRTPLHIALRREGIAIVRCMLNAGSDVRAIDKWGTTPLHFAAASATAEPVRTLLDAGADYSVTDIYGQTPLDMARANDNWAAALHLLDMGVDK